MNEIIFFRDTERELPAETLCVEAERAEKIVCLRRKRYLVLRITIEVK